MIRATIGIHEKFVAGAFDIVTGDIERLSGKPARPLREVLTELLSAAT